MKVIYRILAVLKPKVNVLYHSFLRLTTFQVVSVIYDAQSVTDVTLVSKCHRFIGRHDQ